MIVFSEYQKRPGRNVAAGVIDRPDHAATKRQGAFVLGADHMRAGLATELMDGRVFDVGADHRTGGVARRGNAAG